jgi:hypothetical protein
MRRRNAAASSSICKDAMMNDQPDPLVSAKILETLHRREGKPAWYEIATSIGAFAVGQHYECLNALRLLGQAGILRSEASDGAIRFWIAEPRGLPQRKVG